MQYSGIPGERIIFGIPSLREHIGHILARNTIQHNKLVYEFYNILISKWNQKDSATYLFGSTLSDSLTNQLCVSKHPIRITELNFFTNLLDVFVQESIKDVVCMINGKIMENKCIIDKYRDYSYIISYDTCILNVWIHVVCNCYPHRYHNWISHYKCKTLVSNCKLFKQKCKETLYGEHYPEHKICYQIIPSDPANHIVVYDVCAYMYIQNREREISRKCINDRRHCNKLCQDCKIWKFSNKSVDLLVERTIPLPYVSYDNVSLSYVSCAHLDILFQHIIHWGDLNVLEKIYERLFNAWLMEYSHINKLINHTFRQLIKKMFNDFNTGYQQICNEYIDQYTQMMNKLNSISFPRYLHISRGIAIARQSCNFTYQNPSY